MDTIVGGFVTVSLGVIVVAAIYQLGAHNNPVAADVTNISTTTLASLYK
jgi:hypothetical protein